MHNTARPLAPARSAAITKAHARRLVARDEAESRAQQAQGRCDCGLHCAEDRCPACKAADKRAARKLFGGL
jgi:hypothetical protein